jgi:hypothetical protein
VNILARMSIGLSSEKRPTTGNAIAIQGCHVDDNGQTDGWSDDNGQTDGWLDDGRGGVRDLDAL